MKKFFKEKINYILAFFVPLSALVLSVTITKPIYMINDDFIFRSAIEGRYFGTHSEFIFFIHFIYMKFLKFLYLLNNNLPWYDLLFALFIFISFFAITLITNKLLNNIFFKIINSFILLFFSFIFFTTFQFTLVSEILAISAAVFAGYIFISDKTSKRENIIGFIYIVLASTISSLIRAEALPLILLVSLIMSVFFINKFNFSKKKIFLLTLICLTFFANRILTNYNIAVQNRELPNFVEYNGKLNFFNVRANYVTENINLNKYIKKIEPELNKSNYTENDFKLLLKWYTTGDNIYSGENLNILYKNISQKIFPKQDINSIINKFPNKFSTYFFKTEFILLQLLIIFALVLLVFKKEYLYRLISMHFIFICILTILDIWLNVFPFRVYFPLLVLEYTLMIFSAYYYKQYFIKFKKLTLINVFLIIASLTALCYYDVIKRVQHNNNKYTNYSAIKNFDFNSYGIIFIEPLMGWCMLSPYDMNYTNMNNKILYNWNVYTKHYDYKMRKLNMERNLYSNLLRNNVYLLGFNTSPVKELEQSLREHQNTDTKAFKVDTILADKIYLYKFIPKEKINQNQNNN